MQGDIDAEIRALRLVRNIDRHRFRNDRRPCHDDGYRKHAQQQNSRPCQISGTHCLHSNLPVRIVPDEILLRLSV
ncbi:hypothetical protein [Oxalicibacterium flavum]|uniref:hypothetical protein n=1 Tax=Oxalicibacterium flavum TaxID=179467 RepID=UPI001E54C669|nr:hypothetical protein [Oxalicibacterium flavum]